MRSPSTQAKDIFRLGHMIEYSSLVLHYGSEKTEDDLKDDITLSLSLVKLIEILGEAANHISEELRNQITDIPWDSIIDMRNRLVHSYFDIDYSIIVSTIERRIPPLLEQLLSLKIRLDLGDIL